MTGPHRCLHVYVDESGNLAGRLGEEEIRLVGGVALLGPEDESLQEQLKRALGAACGAAGVPFPDGLHGSSFRNSPDLRGRFFDSLRARLAEINGTSPRLFGIAVRHNEDLLPLAASVARETALDNRYKALLWTLLEHLLFVDYQTARLLTPAPEARLTVASRMWVDRDGAYDNSRLRELGMQTRMVEDRDELRGPQAPRANLGVPGILRESDLLTMIQMGVRNGWPSRQLDVTGVRVEGLDYHRGSSSPGLYLADIYLSSLRQSLKRQQRSPAAPILPTLLFLQHSHKTEALARARRALLANDPDLCMEQVPVLLPADSPYTASTLGAMLPDLASQLFAAPDRLLAWWQTTARRLTTTGRFEEGTNLLSILTDLRPHGDCSSFTPGQRARAAYLAAHARLTAANRIGDMAAADAAWGDFLKVEPDLDALGLEALSLRAAVRRTRAVSQMEQFLYPEAREAVDALIDEFEETDRKLSAAGLPRLGEHERRVLSELYMTRGEIACAATAFAGKSRWPLWQKGEQDLRTALSLSDYREDKRRIAIFLGHLACDLGPGGASLWKEVCAKLPNLAAPEPCRGRDNLDLLALQAKAFWKHEPPAAQGAFLKAWIQADPLDSLLPEERNVFPVGLILQDAGLMALEQGRSLGRKDLSELGLRLLPQAAAALSSGGALLKLLACGAHMRLALFRLDAASPGSDAARDAGAQLRTAMDSFKGLCRTHWGQRLWKDAGQGADHGLIGSLAAVEADLPARARAVLSSFRMRLV